MRGRKLVTSLPWAWTTRPSSFNSIGRGQKIERWADFDRPLPRPRTRGRKCGRKIRETGRGVTCLRSDTPTAQNVADLGAVKVGKLSKIHHTNVHAPVAPPRRKAGQWELVDEIPRPQNPNMSQSPANPREGLSDSQILANQLFPTRKSKSLGIS